MAHIGQRFLLLKLAANLNESCLNCSDTSERLIKLNESLCEVVCEEVSQCLIKWPIFFLEGVFVLSQEY